jgi:hypothetical protein
VRAAVFCRTRLRQLAAGLSVPSSDELAAAAAARRPKGKKQALSGVGLDTGIADNSAGSRPAKRTAGEQAQDVQHDAEETKACVRRQRWPGQGLHFHVKPLWTRNVSKHAGQQSRLPLPQGRIQCAYGHTAQCSVVHRRPEVKAAAAALGDGPCSWQAVAGENGRQREARGVLVLPGADGGLLPRRSRTAAVPTCRSPVRYR